MKLSAIALRGFDDKGHGSFVIETQEGAKLDIDISPPQQLDALLAYDHLNKVMWKGNEHALDV